MVLFESPLVLTLGITFTGLVFGWQVVQEFEMQSPSAFLFSTSQDLLETSLVNSVSVSFIICIFLCMRFGARSSPLACKYNTVAL